MLKLFEIYYLIGLLIVIVVCFDSSVEDIKKGKQTIFTTIVGLGLLAMVAPIILVRGMIDALKTN